MNIEEEKARLSKEINRKASLLYYYLHKDEMNKKRKNYRRQPWSERADNPNRKKEDCS